LEKYWKVLLLKILRLEEMKKRKYQWKNRLRVEPFSTISENNKGSAIVVISSEKELNW